MLNVKGLPDDQCYFEYPDASIELVSFVKDKREFLPIKKLSALDGNRLRKRLGLA